MDGISGQSSIPSNIGPVDDDERTLQVQGVSQDAALKEIPASGEWTRSAMKLLGSVDTRRYPRSENRVWSDQEDHEERESKDRTASTCGPHSDSFNDTNRCRRSNCSTISRHFAEANLKSKRPFRALPLTPEHRQLRLQWCQARSMWNVTDWQKVVFSDESRFVLGTDDNRERVWRRPGERYNSPHTFLRHTAHTAGVMVWGGHSL
ncbi:hypothetical protein TNCV_1541721 [Trichonephila clavipes]|nr:hypothetical protein TNCV_1541721 [Trichonephila clavipes]